MTELHEDLPLAPGSLSGKTALVTGSSRGIGADTVRYFAQAGANVVINYRNKAPRAEKLAANVQAFVDRVMSLKPSGVKGIYVKSAHLSAAMSPSRSPRFCATCLASALYSSDSRCLNARSSSSQRIFAMPKRCASGA